MTSQRFCLRWNNHQSNLLSVFDQLLHAETFTDVTLAVEGQYLKAHKMVLSACSPYFQSLFTTHDEKHPIVIIKDVSYADMKSLLDFMYRGEVSVDQERLTAFLKVAESLRIKGLTEVNEDKQTFGGNVGGTSSTPPPQLHRLQNPYFAQQKKSQGMLLTNPLLGSALTMPKRKRGRPRKLSGSSNGDFDDYESNDNIIHGSPEMLEVKMGTEGFSDIEGSDDKSRNEPSNSDRRNSRNESMDTNDVNANPKSSTSTTQPPASSSKECPRKDIDKDSSSDPAEFGLLIPKLEPAEYNSTQYAAVTTLPIKPVMKIRINANARQQPPTTINQFNSQTSGAQNNSPTNLSNSPATHQQQQQRLQHHESMNINNNNNNNTPTTISELTSMLSSSAAHRNATNMMMGVGGSMMLPPASPQHQHQQQQQQQYQIGLGSGGPLNNNTIISMSDGNGNNTSTTPNSRPAVRRRVRRKTNSSPDDQAEQLTEMSVRGLNLFRYASIVDGVYQCTECAKDNIQKTFKNKYSFQRHAFLYHEGSQRKVFPCPVCSKEFSRPDKMKNHMKTTHECYMPRDCVYPLNLLIGSGGGGAAGGPNSGGEILNMKMAKMENVRSTIASVSSMVSLDNSFSNSMLTGENLTKKEKMDNVMSTIASVSRMDSSLESLNSSNSNMNSFNNSMLSNSLAGENLIKIPKVENVLSTTQ